MTAYDRATHALRDVPLASRSSQIPELHKNAAGSIDTSFGPKTREGKESNLVPTDPNREFELMFRRYAPTKALFDRRGSFRMSKRSRRSKRQSNLIPARQSRFWALSVSAGAQRLRQHEPRTVFARLETFQPMARRRSDISLFCAA